MKRFLRSSAATMLAGATMASSLITSPALACGGFFCGVNTPVDQAAERIIFAQDEEGKVTQIVEVLYDGPAENFAWVLPVPGVPEPDVSSSQVFDRLQGATEPSYFLDYTGWCDGEGFNRGSVDLETSAPQADGDETGGVQVLDSGSVGPFDFETISVDVDDEDPAGAAVRWLEENEYDVGPMGAEVLGPYLANGLNLIAFRLQKGQSAGAIRPIVLEYEANAMAIPIRPTAVAAADDMPVLVWTLGASRAVPTNYRDLEINELLIDWFNWRATYNDVVTAAANEAGGQGFVTEYAKSTEGLSSSVRPEDFEVDGALAVDTDDVPQALQEITWQLGSFDGFDQAAADHLTFREGVVLEDFLACSWCYFQGGEALNANGDRVTFEPAAEDDPILATDLDAFRASLNDNVLQPFFDAADLIDSHDYVTRLYTTMSADEMTLDPDFELNPDAEDVERARTATYTPNCDDEGSWEVELPDGRKVYGTGDEWPYALGDEELPVNLRVLQYSTSGEPDVITDNRATIQTVHESRPAGQAPSSSQESGGGCSYGTSSAPTSWFGVMALLGFLGLGIRRKRTA